MYIFIITIIMDSMMIFVLRIIIPIIWLISWFCERDIPIHTPKQSNRRYSWLLSAKIVLHESRKFSLQMSNILRWLSRSIRPSKSLATLISQVIQIYFYIPKRQWIVYYGIWYANSQNMQDLYERWMLKDESRTHRHTKVEKV